jgi:hypothetical protein
MPVIRKDFGHFCFIVGTLLSPSPNFDSRELAGTDASRRRFTSQIAAMEPVYNDELTAAKWALNSAVECHPHTVEVIGSNPIAPTIYFE